MTEQQYSDLWDLTQNQSNPWKHPELYGQPGVHRRKWRVAVKLTQRALKEVLGDG